MADAYERVKGGRLTFKGGDVASLSKSIDKKNKIKKKKKKSKFPKNLTEEILTGDDAAAATEDGGGGGASSTAAKPGADEAIYTIDAAKKMKYEELFPVEAKKFRYDPKAKVTSVEDALDDRVKKKADRYCK